MKNYFLILVLLSFAQCGIHDETEQITHLRVNSHTVACTGVGEGKCLLVQEGDAIGTEDWEYFYFEDSIKGFDYEPGYVYDLAVKKIPVEDPPMDGSAFEYELVKILSKEPAS